MRRMRQGDFAKEQLLCGELRGDDGQGLLFAVCSRVADAPFAEIGRKSEPYSYEGADAEESMNRHRSRIGLLTLSRSCDIIAVE